MYECARSPSLSHLTIAKFYAQKQLQRNGQIICAQFFFSFNELQMPFNLILLFYGIVLFALFTLARAVLHK